MKTKAWYLFMFLILAMFAGCYSYATKIRLSGSNRPTFKVSGSGEIINFTLYGPRQREGNDEAAWIVWKFEPISSTDWLDDLNTIGSIKYGEVPKGYRQIYPEKNEPPPSLVAGASYGLHIFTINAPWGQIAFELREGKLVELPIK